MPHIQDEIRIDAPVAHVWEFLCDTAHWSDWNPRTECSGFSGPIDQVGTTFSERSKILGFEMKDTDRVLQVEPQRLIHIRTETYPSDVYFRFQPDGDATRFAVEGDYDMPGHLPGFIQKLMTKTFVERHTRQMMEDIKALAEAKVPVPA